MANQFAGRFFDALFNTSSKLLKNTQFYVATDADGLNIATTYTDRTKATVASAILGTDDKGMAEFYAVPGTYYLKIQESIQKVEVYEDIADTADVQYVDGAIASEATSAAHVADNETITGDWNYSGLLKRQNRIIPTLVIGHQADQGAATNYPNPTIYFQDDVNSGTPQISNGATWVPFAAAGRHAERHGPDGADPIDFDAIGIEETANKGLPDGYMGLDGDLRGSNPPQVHGLEHGNFGVDRVVIDPSQVVGFERETFLPLGANDTFVGEPIAVSGYLGIDVAGTGEQAFSVRIDTSTDEGLTFSSGTVRAASAGVAGFAVVTSMVFATAVTHVRCVVLNSGTAQTTFQLDRALQRIPAAVQQADLATTNANVAANTSSIASNTSAIALRALMVVPTAVKTAAYTASANELVLVDVLGRNVNDVVLNTGTPTTLTSATAAFTSADVGRTLLMRSNHLPPETTILSVQSATSITMSANALATGSALALHIAGSAPVTLPASAPVGTVVEVKKMDSSPHNAVVIPSGADDIDGKTNITFNTRHESKVLRKGSSTSWTVESGLAPMRGPGSGRLDRSSGIYLPTDGCLSILRGAIARARAGVGVPARILCKGDSTTYGVLGGGGNGSGSAYNPNSVTQPQLISWPDRVRKLLTTSSILGGRVDEGAIWFPDTGDTRFTLGTGWTAGWGATFGTATGNFTFVDENTSDAYDLLITKSSPTMTTFTVTIDGGSPTTVNVAPQTTSTTAIYRVTTTLGANHSVVISPPAAGTYVIKAVVPVQTTVPPIATISRYGSSGQLLSNLMSAGSIAAAGGFHDSVNIYKPDAAFLMMGINDMHANAGSVATDVATYKTNLISFVTLVRAVNADPILMVFPSIYYALQNPGVYEALPYHQAIYEVADEYSVAVLDVQRRWGYGWGPANYIAVGGVNPVPMYDGVHPTLAGYADLAAMVARFLSRID